MSPTIPEPTRISVAGLRRILERCAPAVDITPLGPYRPSGRAPDRVMLRVRPWRTDEPTIYAVRASDLDAVARMVAGLGLREPRFDDDR